MTFANTDIINIEKMNEELNKLKIIFFIYCSNRYEYVYFCVNGSLYFIKIN